MVTPYPRPNPHLRHLEPVPHGSIGDAELAALGLRRADVVDFSASTNPLGPSPAAIAAAHTAAWDRYPDDAAVELRRELAARDGVAESAVVVGNGSAELIWLLALAFLAPGAAALVVAPTFGEYARAARVVGAVAHEHETAPAGGFVPDPAAVAAAARRVGARVLFLGNPNNPTGALLPASALAALGGDLPGTLVVVDEAYRGFVDHPPATEPLLSLGNLLLLRSLTKDHALPGLRLGYALAPAPLRDALDRVRPAWSVNSVAQAAGLAAVRERAHLERSRAEVRRARAFLVEALGGLGFPVVPPSANFLLVEVGDGAAVRAALLQRGLVVRDCASFGLPAHVRIGLRTLTECERLATAFAGLPRPSRNGVDRG